MSFVRGRRLVNRHEQLCGCDHPAVTHYTKWGGCIYDFGDRLCDCKAFKPKGNKKFQNKRARCEYGHSHDSGLEIKTCFDLYCLQRGGHIVDFKFHPVLDLLGPSGHVVATYEIDFIAYYGDGTAEYIECKGRHLEREEGWRLKWALLKDLHKGDPKCKFRVIIG